MTDPRLAPELPEHYFRHEFGRLVSVLSRRFGVHRLELCEDAAQAALLRAVQSWPEQGVPDNKSGWLYRVAMNEVLGSLRREKRIELTVDHAEQAAAGDEEGEQRVYLESEVKDDQLRLLFVCGDPAIPLESQIVLALKTLCGFSTGEIALRLFQSEDAVHKRLQRARASLRDKSVELETPGRPELANRLPAVLHMLYLLFTEGYSSAQPDTVIRRELCQEAVRLGLLLVEHLTPLRDPRGRRSVAAQHFESIDRDRRMEGRGSGSRSARSSEASCLAPRLLSLGCNLGRALPPPRRSRARALAPYLCAGRRADSSGKGIAAAAARGVQRAPRAVKHAMNQHELGASVLESARAGAPS